VPNLHQNGGRFFENAGWEKRAETQGVQKNGKSGKKPERARIGTLLIVKMPNDASE
jgi:hypothetical protein